MKQRLTEKIRAMARAEIKAAPLERSVYSRYTERMDDPYPSAGARL